MRFNEWTVMCVSSNDAQVWTITSVCTVYNVWMYKYIYSEVYKWNECTIISAYSGVKCEVAICILYDIQW